ncbi:MAG: tetratricopeptide repeat protein [Chitinophagaceae bacterium]|nr:MAG: tetratricopeptide repeat protein [Chitinophagaceae bacterium]
MNSFRYKSFLVIFIFLHLSAFDVNGQLPKDGDMWYKSGMKAKETSDYTAALQFFETALRHKGDSVKILTAMGKSKHALNKFSDAVWYFEEALKKDPIFLPAMSGICLSLALSGEKNEAVRFCDKAVSEYPDSAISRLNRAKVWIELEKPELALEDLEILSFNFPENLSVMLTHGLALYELGKYQEAATYFEYVVSTIESHASGHHNLGMSYMALGNNEQALQAFDRAIYHNSDLSSALFNRGLLRIGMKKQEEGCLDLERAKNLDKSLAEEAFERFCR